MANSPLRSSFDEKQIMATPDPKDDKAYVMENGNGDGARRKRFLCWMVTKKQWLAALIGSILIVLLVVLLVIFLAVVPAIFQSQVDKVKLSLNYMDIKSFASEGDSNKIDVELSVHVDIDAMASTTLHDAKVSLYFDDKAFTTVSLPKTKFKKGENSIDIVIRDNADITDADTFRALSKVLITEKDVTVEARSRVKATALGLSYGDLKFERPLAVKAFDQFQNPQPIFNNITLSECSETDLKMLINVTLSNPSVVGVAGIGALNLTVSVAQGVLGQAISTDAELGIPRGATPMVLELTIPKSPSVMPALVGLLKGVIAMDTTMYATGNHPHVSTAAILDQGFAQLNVTMPYKDGLAKITLNPKCDISPLLAAAAA